jgi:hypothetical protein
MLGPEFGGRCGGGADKQVIEGAATRLSRELGSCFFKPPKSSLDSARLGVHLHLKISQRPLTDLEKPVLGAVKVLNQKYDHRKGEDYS